MCGKLFLFLSLDLDWAEVDSREGSRIPYPKPENQFRAKTIHFQVKYTSISRFFLPILLYFFTRQAVAF